MASVLHLTHDNERLTPDDFEQASALINRARVLTQDAGDYVFRHGLRPDIHLPAGDWTATGASSFPGWNPTMIEHVRLVSPFSGFDLGLWTRQGGGEASDRNRFYHHMFGDKFDDLSLDQLIADLGTPERMIASSELMIGSWEKLIKGVPERFQAKLRAAGGEIGIVYDGHLLNHDILNYQSRINALFACGELDRLETLAKRKGHIEYLEIGPGAANFAVILNDCLQGRLNAHLVDLPVVLGNACAYLSATIGSANVDIVRTEARRVDKRFVLVANYLLPAYEQHLPEFDLVHNAISMNEMSVNQVKYYAGLISRTISQEAMFYLPDGHKELDSHVDAREILREVFPCYETYGGDFGGISLMETTNFFSKTRRL